jgi:malonyl-CoA/methylmalonyl-CoA synthetase
MKELELIARARSHGEAIALRSEHEVHTYADLLARSGSVAGVLLESTGDGDDRKDLNEGRVAFLAPAGFGYVTLQWAIWRAGGIAVPLCLAATEPEYEYTLSNSGTSLVLATREYADRIGGLCERLGLKLIVLEDLKAREECALPEIAAGRRAMILYTSGTTSKPKGVVTTHAHIQAQIETLVAAWEWQAADRIPLFLPLHHVHGIINVLACALWSGAIVEPFPRFELQTILRRVAADAYTVFMAVPTIYVKLIQALDSMTDSERSPIVAAFGRLRLMVSGSAALPASVHKKWTQLTGQKLLERYGMTEIGMALSNPFHGERRPGAVGQALPGVQIRLRAESGDLITAEGEPGEIQVRGPAVFDEYWERPEVTGESFDEGWFRTGDMAVLETGYYRIMGRLSVDIIKSGGYKLSALEIEAALLEHPSISECAVIGVPDETWGEAVAAAVVLREETSLTLETLRDWCRDRLSVYKIPKQLKVLEVLPRNAMGKVTKPAVKELLS